MESFELREAFQLFDTNKDGKLTFDELDSLFKKLRADGKIKPSEIRALVSVADRDKNGTIEFNVRHHFASILLYRIHQSNGENV